MRTHHGLAKHVPFPFDYLHEYLQCIRYKPCFKVRYFGCHENEEVINFQCYKFKFSMGGAYIVWLYWPFIFYGMSVNLMCYRSHIGIPLLLSHVCILMKANRHTLLLVQLVNISKLMTSMVPVVHGYQWVDPKHNISIMPDKRIVSQTNLQLMDLIWIFETRFLFRICRLMTLIFWIF